MAALSTRTEGSSLPQPGPAEQGPGPGLGTQPHSEGQLDGVWLNADCPWEYYTVSGQRVRRTNAQGSREFSIHWNPARLSWQWGRHGRLTMQWLGIDSIAWVPDMSFEHSRVWRWRRVCEHSRHARREHRSRSRSRNWRCYRRARSEAPLPCGLTHREVYSLLSREITPEDYEMLLRLDETVPKKGKATEEETSEALHSVSCAEFMGKQCPICLTRYEKTDDVSALPCSHEFHRECICTWLSNYRKTCPLCCTELETHDA